MTGMSFLLSCSAMRADAHILIFMTLWEPPAISAILVTVNIEGYRWQLGCLTYQSGWFGVLASARFNDLVCCQSH